MNISFFGIRSVDEMRLILKCYDSPEISSYPVGSEWSYSRYFFPQGYNRRERLEKDAKTIFGLFSDLRKEHGVSAEFELPREYFAFTVENALKKNGTHGNQLQWLSVALWREAFELSGYVESEIYMALV